MIASSVAAGRHFSTSPDEDGFNLRAAIKSTLQTTIKRDNDANVAAFAEQKLGLGRRHSTNWLRILTFGTGVGNGLIIDRSIRSGSAGMGGEAGHTRRRDSQSSSCGCGGAGCLEENASATAIVRLAREIMGASAPTSASELAALARERNPAAIELFHSIGSYLAVALTGLINTLNLPLSILDGGVSEAWDLFSPAMFA